MIALLAAGDARGYGIATALVLDGVPFRRVERPGTAAGALLVVTRPLGPAEQALTLEEGDGERVAAPLPPLEPDARAAVALPPASAAAPEVAR